MKQLFIIGALLTGSLLCNAETLTAKLDFSRLYNRTNAGVYDVTLDFNIFESADVQISQEIVPAPGDDQPYSDYNVCHTEIRLNVGYAKLNFVDTKKRDLTSLAKNLELYTGYYDETDKCSNAADLLTQGKLSFTAYYYFGSFILKYRAPADFKNIEAGFYAFPFGYSVNLQVVADRNGKLLVPDLKSQLLSQVKRGNKEGISYHVYASKDDSTLTLGTGYAELK